MSVLYCGGIAGASAEPILRAGIQHTENLPALNPNLQPGNDFSVQNLGGKSHPPSNEWYSLPAFMAGRAWYSDFQEDTYYQNLRTGEEKFNLGRSPSSGGETWTWEQDAKGGFWAPQDYPFTQQVQGADHVTYQYHKSRETLSVTSVKFVERMYSIHTEVLKATNQIRRTFQSEQIITYTPEGPNLVRKEYSCKNFDMSGKPISLTKAFTICQLKQPFKDVGAYNGKNWRQEFLAFLKSKGLVQLIPMSKN